MPHSHLSEIIRAIDSLLNQSASPLMISIDGDSGSGKTTLGQQLQQHYKANLIHVDDFYLPKALRTKERFSVPGGNIHTERLLQLLLPLNEGIAADYTAYTPWTDRFEFIGTIAPQALTIVEGSYSQLPVLRSLYQFTIFLKIDSQTQYERLKQREGASGVQRFLNEWIPREKAYHKRDNVEAQARLVIDVTKS